jgi:hypothetical protein
MCKEFLRRQQRKLDESFMYFYRSRHEGRSILKAFET